MNNEELVRCLIKGSTQRAIQESVAALIVVIAFTAILLGAEAGSPRFFGCLVILIGSGFIVGVVWSHALSYRLLGSHPAYNVGFWREAFAVQAKLLRLEPLWYCAPICGGGVLFGVPTKPDELIPFFIGLSIFALAFIGITWLNRNAATKLDKNAMQLTA